jgi:hypothetical protein
MFAIIARTNESPMEGVELLHHRVMQTRGPQERSGNFIGVSRFVAADGGGDREQGPYQPVLLLLTSSVGFVGLRRIRAVASIWHRCAFASRGAARGP